MAVGMIQHPTGEARLETGEGLITGIEMVEGQRNGKVTFRATHADLRKPVTAWADRNDAELMAALLAAQESRQVVAYRIVVKRKRSVDAGVPFSELEATDKVRDLEAVGPPGSTPQAVPGANGNGGGAAPSETPRQAAQAGRTAPKPADDAQAPTEAPAAAESPTERRGPKLEEAKPWEPLNSDGSVNLGSYEMTATLGMVELAAGLLTQRDRTTRLSCGAVAPDQPAVDLLGPKAGALRALARHLLTAADQAQANVRPDGRIDRMDNSHTRARGAVRTALERVPPPWEHTTDRDTVAAWVAALTDEATTLLDVAIELLP